MDLEFPFMVIIGLIIVLLSLSIYSATFLQHSYGETMGKTLLTLEITSILAAAILFILMIILWRIKSN